MPRPGAQADTGSTTRATWNACPLIRRSRALGFPLDEVRTLLDAVDGGAYSCAEVKALTLRQLAEVRKKIVELRKLEKALQRMAQECDGGGRLPCPIVEALRA